MAVVALLFLVYIKFNAVIFEAMDMLIPMMLGAYVFWFILAKTKKNRTNTF